RLEAGRVGVRKALLWAAQIASGLAAAHQKGVIHRDLKPENVFITPGELLKILDFGLATTAMKPEDSATLVRTDPGTVMGTAHYMSPEQVRGDSLDARSDIFALGIVLFELLTGHVPFHARSAVETMNSILVDEPPEIANVPDAVQDLVHRCLEKDPSRRFTSARDLAFARESAAKTITTSTPTPSVAPAASGRPRAAGPTRLIALGLIAAGIAAAAILSRDSPAPEPPRLRTLTYSGRDTAPAASPDGRLIAYVSSRDGRQRIWLKQLADGTEAAVTAGPDDTAPRFTPDGAALLFTRTIGGTSAIYRVGVVGGDPRKLIDNAFDGDWSPDAKRIAFIRNRTAKERVAIVCIAPVDGGSVREIAATTEEDFSAPRWSPDGRWIAISVRPRGTKPGSLMLVDVESGEKRMLVREEPHGLLSGAAWTRDGSALVYAELEALAGTGLPRRRGSSVIVLHDVSSGRSRVLLRNAHSAADTVDLAGNGRIVFTEDVTLQNLQEVALQFLGVPRSSSGSSADRGTPRNRGTEEPRPSRRWLSRGMSVDRQPAYTPGGRSVVFASDRGGNIDIWELMLDSGGLRHLTDHAAIDWDPHPSPDGTSLYWSSSRGGHFEVWTASVDGANPQQVTRDGVDAENPTLPTDGNWIYYDSSNQKSDGLWRIPRGGGAAQLVIAAETIHPAVSADGQYVVYQRPEEGGGSAIDVVRVSDRKVFSLATGLRILATRARWIGNTHTIAYRAHDEAGRVTLFAQDFAPDAAASRRELLPADSDAAPETFAISPDGTRALLSVIDEASGLMMAEGVAGIE
ncbi:MAG: protein kinase domain-containing protein, partial [Thermoanaerobaculia bacterium]